MLRHSVRWHNISAMVALCRINTQRLELHALIDSLFK